VKTEIVMANKPLKSQPDASRDLRIAEQFQRRVLESAVAAVSVIDLEGRFVTVSQRGLEITGYSNRELQGKHCTFLVVPEERERINAILEAVLNRGESFSKLETIITCKDGASKNVTFDVSPITLDNKIVAAVATGEDVSIARRAQAELRRSCGCCPLVFSIYRTRRDVESRGNFMTVLHRTCLLSISRFPVSCSRHARKTSEAHCGSVCPYASNRVRKFERCRTCCIPRCWMKPAWCPR
jgi:PAS domain S-box-containing protein